MNAPKSKALLSRPINWNVVDPWELEVWNTLNSNIWFPERIALSQDAGSWATLTEQERLVTMRVFAGLTLLDTIQAFFAAPALMLDAKTPHEAAIFSQIGFMENIHARSYSSIFATLASTSDSDEAFRWAEENEHLKIKADLVLSYYEGEDPLKRKIVSVFLESFLFYSGFYLPLYWASRAKLTNTADIIRLIMRDESLHGVFIGGLFIKALGDESPERQAELKDFAYEVLLDLYDNELAFTKSMYDELGMTEDVTRFLAYNANKALQNLGFEALFPAELTNVSVAIMASLSLGSETHDFFSGAGSSYVQPKVKDLSEAEWSF